MSCGPRGFGRISIVFSSESMWIVSLKATQNAGIPFDYLAHICIRLAVTICRVYQRPRILQRKAALTVPLVAFALGLLGSNPLQLNAYKTKPLTLTKDDALLPDGSYNKWAGQAVSHELLDTHYKGARPKYIGPPSSAGYLLQLHERVLLHERDERKHPKSY